MAASAYTATPHQAPLRISTTSEDANVSDRQAPRALLVRPAIVVEITPGELYQLIRALEAEAARAAQDPAQVDFADYLYRRVAELREAAR
jgi:hypothetical protein